MSSINKNPVVVFKTKVLYFKIENMPIKDTSGKRKFKRMLSFLLWTYESFSLLSFEGFNLVFFTGDQSAWLVLNQPRQHSVYSMVETTFLKGNFCIYKGFMDILISTFLYRRERKPQNLFAFKIDFLAMCSVDIQFKCYSSYANCFLGLTYEFFNANFHVIISYSSVILLIHNISSKHDRETTDHEIFRNPSDGLPSILELIEVNCFLYIGPILIELLFIFLFIPRHSRILQFAALITCAR